MRRVEIVPYSKHWREQFFQEQQLLSAIAPDLILKIHHIGSTSVPDLAAKPIIDILMVVSNIAALDGHNLSFESLGYEVMGEFGITGRRYFRKGGINRSHQIHAFGQDDPGIARHLAFRDYLRTFAKVRQEYEQVKKQAALLCQHDIQVYMDEKNDYIQETEAKALHWWSKHQHKPA